MNEILIGRGERPVHLLGKYGNRHGLIAGATGTGKTISLMVLAEGFSRMGVPVFLADVKGDVSGLAMATCRTLSITLRSGAGFPRRTRTDSGTPQHGTALETTSRECGSFRLISWASTPSTTPSFHSLSLKGRRKR